MRVGAASGATFGLRQRSVYPLFLLSRKELTYWKHPLLVRLQGNITASRRAVHQNYFSRESWTKYRILLSSLLLTCGRLVHWYVRRIACLRGLCADKNIDIRNIRRSPSVLYQRRDDLGAMHVARRGRGSPAVLGRMAEETWDATRCGGLVVEMS